jgi:hypothetical protein
VVTHINIISLNPHLKTIERLLNETTTICNKINLTSLFDCTDISTSTQILLQSNFAKSISLSHLLSQNTTINKFKRSIEVGGTILKFFFGTLDADDARKYDSAIESSQKNEHEIFHLMKENIHIVKSSINAFNSSISKINSNEIKINTQLEHMSQAISQVTKVNEQLTYMSRVNNLVNVIESSLLTISNYLDSILNAILFSKANILHPSILSPTMLYHELTKNNKNSNKNSDFPVPVTIENIHTIIDISKLTSYYFNKKMVFVLSIPLTYPERYTVYKSLPLPVPHEIENPNTFSLIHPTSSYIAISDNKLHYTLLDDLSICTTVSSEYSICPLLTIYSSISNPCCETRLFTEVSKSLPKECDSKLIFGEVDIWHVLNNNKWIFVQSKPCHLTIQCNDNIEDYSVSGTGVLKLTDDCVGFSKTIKLLPSMSKYVSVRNNLFSEFNILKDDCCKKERFNHTLPLMTPITLSKINLDSLKYASHKLDNLENDLDNLQQQSHFIKYGNYYSSVTLSLICFVILYFLIKCIKHFWCYSNKHRRSASSCCTQIFGNYQKNPKSLPSNSIEMTGKQSKNDEISVKSLPIPDRNPRLSQNKFNSSRNLSNY